MSILNDLEIGRLAEAGMIEPYVDRLVRHHQGRQVLSFGAGSYGYDIRLSPNDFRVFRHVPGTVVDPKGFNDENLEEVMLRGDNRGRYFILPAHSYGLGVSVEHFSLPPDITAIFLGKSTYARCGVIANATPGEAGWRGHLTLEFSNSSGADVRLYVEEGIVQALFFRGEPCTTSYEDRAGKYMDQPPIVVTAKI